MLTYFGLCDCHGIESFIPITDFALEKLQGKSSTYHHTLQMLNLRAQTNRHRHTVIYRVKLKSNNAKNIQDLVDKGKYKEALVKLKGTATEVEIGKGMEKSWKMIPNDNLDPYS